MEGLNHVLQSLSPYVVISLIGDPVKSTYASSWGTVSPMPNVWINRYDYNGKHIIVNIWDSPKTSSNPDHTVIVIDRKNTQSPRLLDLLSKDNPDKQTVLFVGGENIEDIKDCKDREVKHVNAVDSIDIIRDICFKIYKTRCFTIDKQIRQFLLNAKKHED
jgi:hypothetical protein